MSCAKLRDGPGDENVKSVHDKFPKQEPRFHNSAECDPDPAADQHDLGLAELSLEQGNSELAEPYLGVAAKMLVGEEEPVGEEAL